MKLDEDDDATQRTGACIDKDLCLRPRLLDGRVVIFAQLSQNKRVFHFIIPPPLMVCYQQRPPSMSCEWKNKYGRSGVVGEEEDGDDDAVAAADDDNTKAGNTDNNVGPNNKQEKWGARKCISSCPCGRSFHSHDRCGRLL